MVLRSPEFASLTRRRRQRGSDPHQLRRRGGYPTSGSMRWRPARAPAAPGKVHILRTNLTESPRASGRRLSGRRNCHRDSSSLVRVPSAECAGSEKVETHSKPANSELGTRN